MTPASAPQKKCLYDLALAIRKLEILKYTLLAEAKQVSARPRKKAAARNLEIQPNSITKDSRTPKTQAAFGEQHVIILEVLAADFCQY